MSLITLCDGFSKMPEVPGKNLRLHDGFITDVEVFKPAMNPGLEFILLFLSYNLKL